MDKITVMIVDDERLVLEDLRYIVDWEALGFVVVATATNGVQAYEAYKELSPDIVITDIQMPCMDGLELAKRIHEKNKNTTILLLTSFAEFDFAKRAIEYGAAGYIIKTELSQEFMEMQCRKLREAVLAKRRIYEKAIQAVVSDLLHGRMGADKSQIPQWAQMSCYYFVIQEDIPLNLLLREERYVQKRFDTKIPDEIGSVKSDFFNFLFWGRIGDNRILAIARQKDNLYRCDLTSAIRTTAQMLSEWIQEEFGSVVTVYYIGKPMQFSEFREFFEQMHHYMYHHYCFHRKERTANLLKNTQKICMEEKEGQKEIWGNMENIYQWLVRGETEKLQIYWEKMSELLEYVQTPTETLRKLYHTLQNYCENLAKEGKTYRDSFQLACAPSLYSIEECCNWIEEELMRFCEHYKLETEKKYSREICKAMGFIQKNYSDKRLKIDIIADHVGLSSSYLSVVFKKETGKTINAFITEIRVEEAKQLLETGVYRVSEVADMTGYGSSQYFSQIFYLQTGMLPSDYRRRNV